ncbi:MAG: FKBP-type peptidyl-prolyl cis-trans isomerase [Bacteroidota bacterium]
MLKNGLWYGFFILAGFIAACEKPEPYDEEAQSLKDEALIKAWSDSTHISLAKHESGVYYKIVSPGSGISQIELTDTLTVLYQGKLLIDSVIGGTATTDTVGYKFVLESSIPGWRNGLPLIKEGGRIRLLVPSAQAYKNNNIVAGIPKNAVLDFDVQLKKVAKRK